jgi:hypothetical protein
VLNTVSVIAIVFGRSSKGVGMTETWSRGAIRLRVHRRILARELIDHVRKAIAPNLGVERSGKRFRLVYNLSSIAADLGHTARPLRTALAFAIPLVLVFTIPLLVLAVSAA